MRHSVAPGIARYSRRRHVVTAEGSLPPTLLPAWWQTYRVSRATDSKTRGQVDVPAHLFILPTYRNALFFCAPCLKNMYNKQNEPLHLLHFILHPRSSVLQAQAEAMSGKVDTAFGEGSIPPKPRLYSCKPFVAAVVAGPRVNGSEKK